jgi:hypothetical protein
MYDSILQVKVLLLVSNPIKVSYRNDLEVSFISQDPTSVMVNKDIRTDRPFLSQPILVLELPKPTDLNPN